MLFLYVFCVIFFAILLEMDVRLMLKFYLETNMLKLFKYIGVEYNAQNRENVDTIVPGFQVNFFETPTVTYFLYEYTTTKAARKAFTQSQMKGFRTGIQPIYDEKQMITSAAGFGGRLNFENSNTQFE